MKIKTAMDLYLKHLRTIGRSAYTIKGAKYGLKTLAVYLETEKIGHIEDLSREVLEDYQEELAFKMTAKGTQLGLCAREKLIGVAKGFTGFLKQKDYLLHDPGASLTPPRRGRRLPKTILSPAQVRALLNAVDTRTNKGLRDRVILEILYDTGIRRSEAAGIRIVDLDLEAGYIRIRGKGDKQRVVPISTRVCELIGNYMLFVRPVYVKAKDSGHLFLNRSGRPIAPNGIYIIVKHYGSKIKK
jgi:integrase/recombinase XerD